MTAVGRGEQRRVAGRAARFAKVWGVGPPEQRLERLHVVLGRRLVDLSLLNDSDDIRCLRGVTSGFLWPRGRMEVGFVHLE